MQERLDYAVYGEYSLDDKPMQPGANTRIFNTEEARTGDAIGADFETGIITLKRGLYHITAFGTVSYADLGKDTDGKVSTRLRPNGSYCLLYKDGADDPIATGSIGNANMVPSAIDTYVRVEREARLKLVQQAGKDTDGIYLQISLEGSAAESHNHVFARIHIRRLTA